MDKERLLRLLNVFHRLANHEDPTVFAATTDALRDQGMRYVDLVMARGEMEYEVSRRTFSERRENP